MTKKKQKNYFRFCKNKYLGVYVEKYEMPPQGTPAGLLKKIIS